jgi:hypothetical protein
MEPSTHRHPEIRATALPNVHTRGATVALKLAAGLLALALVRPGGRGVDRRLLLGANALASGILLTWGVANVCAGALVLCGVIGLADGLNERALRWHVLV